jgi:CubicO group peptidase (beta-lactamase class C family)
MAGPEASVVARLIVAIALGLLSCSLAPSAAGADTAGLDLAAMNDTFEERLEANGSPGGAIAVADDSRIVDSSGFGDADKQGREVTADTPFLLGSTSKAFTALAVMQLVERGKVELDAPVQDYVPELQPDGEQAGRITVRQVLQHRSGLPLNPAGGPILKGAADGTPAEAVEELRGKELSSEPGTEMAYINANYVVAGLVVERASGMPYAEYVERNIFRPLDMKDSFADPEAAEKAGLAAGHRYLFGATQETGPEFHPGNLAAGYLMSSANDLARYLAMYLNDGVGLNGKRVLSKKGIETILSPAYPETSLGPWADGVESKYAMGWFVGGPWDEPATLHPGDAADSSSLLVLMPEKGIGVAALTNASNELAVPGNPAAIPRAARNAVDALIGELVKTGTSVRTFYLVFDLVIAALLARSLLALYRAVRDIRRSSLPRHRALAIGAVPLRLLAAGLFIFYPTLIGFGHKALFAWHPDLALSVWIIGAVLLAVAVARIVWILRTRGSTRESGRRQSVDVSAG